MVTAPSTVMMEHGMEPDDAELVERALGGNADAFGEVVMRYQSRFRVMVARQVASADDANDIVQDAFIEAWRGLGSFDRSRPVGPWLRAICRHRMIKHLRERARLPASPMAAIDERLAGLAEQDMHKDHADEDTDRRLTALRHCLEQLDARQRAMLTARYRDGLAVQEIAARTKRLPNSVSMALLRLKDGLMRCMAARLSGETTP